MTTKIINLYGGPCSSKSTTAAGLFHLMKTRGHNVELITEVAKEWAWKGHEIKGLDQLRVGFEQVMKEEHLIGKVDYIITDSPSLLSIFYSEYYNHPSFALNGLIENLQASREATHFNVFLPKKDTYKEAGRFQTKEQAHTIHDNLQTWLYERSEYCYEPKVVDLEDLYSKIVS